MNRKLETIDWPARRGFTLLELLITMSFAAGLIGVVTAMLVGILRASGHSRDHAVRQGTISRLAEKLRADVAAADECRPADPADPHSGIGLRGPGGRRVEYLSTAHELRRISYQGPHLDARETYALGETEQARWEIGQESPILVSCVLEKSLDRGGSTASAARRTSIAAVLGRDRRFEQSVSSAVKQQPVGDKPSAETPSDPPENPAEPLENKSQEPENP